ncbi:DDE-type integrase/transposase/recombinase [Lysobacter auxotrophicus]|uniref:DDE-type integrase/transposase/recombinase n=1 Tax=Lysobacter auxotrophicus TaxID=2992573 RepID=A0ABM8D8K8_9GAMM|nr:DDE-type integrase/transposase/recombinase [Lysobacter auxotrophicus]
MAEADLRRHLAFLGLPPEGANYVLSSAAQAHASPSESHARKNITGEFASLVPAAVGDEEMDCRLPFDSLSGEFAYSVISQSDPSVLFALDHPDSIPLTITDRLGRAKRITYTPDYLRITREGVWVEEVKSKDDLLGLCETHQHNWVRRNERFHYLQAEAAFRALGLNFQVVVRDDLSWLRVQNLLLLRLTVTNHAGNFTRGLFEEIASFVERTGYCSMIDVVETLSLDNTVPVLLAIAHEKVHVDLDRASLADAHSKFLSASAVGAKNIGALLSTVQATAATSESLDLLELCDPKHIEEFVYRVATVFGQSTEGIDRKQPHPRTVQRWKRAYAASGFDGLIPKFFNCGKKGARIADWHAELVEEVIREHRASPDIISRAQSRVRYKEILATKSSEVDERPISYSHYCRLWKLRKHSREDAVGRGGKRLANSLAPHGDVDRQCVTAARPFQVAHIDHCYAPAFVEWAEAGRTGQPWLSLLVDDLTKETLARIVRFEAPSFEADALLLRDCQRRHGRLPETIMSDGGPDFRSTMFRACLAALGIHWFKRSAAYSQSGEPVERTFLTFANTVCAGQVGFVPDILNLRSIDRAKHPKKGPRRTWESLIADTDWILFEVLPNLPSTDGSPSPRQVRLEFEALYGTQGLLMGRDLRFLITTAVPQRITGTTESSGAIRFAETRFYSTDLLGRCVPTSSLYPRIDPEDSSVMYFKLDGKWRIAKTRAATEKRGRHDSEILNDRLLEERLTAAEREARTDAMHGAPSKYVPEGRRKSAPQQPYNKPDDAYSKGARPTVTAAAPTDWSAIESFPTFNPEDPRWGTS